jgi:hypothetical protein
MRLACAAAIGVVLLLSQGAAANPAQCQRYDRQILHFQGMVERAQEYGKEDWAEKTQQHVALLMAKRVDAGCPVPVEDSRWAEAFMQLLRLAGSAALTYFTFGAF